MEPSEEKLKEGLCTNRFIEDLTRPYVMDQELEAAYQQMAQDEEREAEALEWAEATIGEVSVC